MIKNVIILLVLFLCNFIEAQQIKPTKDSVLYTLLITDKDTVPEVDALVKIYNKKGEVFISKKNGVDGKVDILLPKNHSFDVKVKKYDTIFSITTLDVPNDAGMMAFEMGVMIWIEHKVLKSYDLNVSFETADFKLDAQDYLLIDELIKQLKNNKISKIEIGAHTDDVGSNQANLLLSQKRASSVREYLILKGFDKEKVFAKGYGETQPKVVNDTPKNRAMNRRVEVKVLE